MVSAETDQHWSGSAWISALYSTYTYDADDRLTAILHRDALGSIVYNTWVSDAYTYDDADRLLTRSVNGATSTFSYDATDQLTSDNGVSQSYDLNGNRTMTGYATGGNNRMTNDGVWTYTYDAEGNVSKRSKGASAETWVYGYDLDNHLTSAEKSATDGGSATARVTYVYDAYGNRVERSSWNGMMPAVERYAQDGWDTAKPVPVGNENFDVILDLSSNNTLAMRRLYGDGFDDLIARETSGGVVHWYATDHQGSVQALVDNSFYTTVGTLVYDSFGAATTNTGSTDRYQYTAREFDSTLGLMYSRARMYDPVSGRFLGLDQSSFSAGDTNLYRYVGNSPTNGTDPSGNWLFTASPEETDRTIRHLADIGVTATPHKLRRSEYALLMDPANTAKFRKYAEGLADGHAKSEILRALGADEHIWFSGNNGAFHVAGVGNYPDVDSVDRAELLGRMKRVLSDEQHRLVDGWEVLYNKNKTRRADRSLDDATSRTKIDEMRASYASTHGGPQYDPNRQGFVQVQLNLEWRRGQFQALGSVVYDQFFREDTDQCIGAPGFGEGMIPIWGNGRSALHAARNGRYGSAVLYGAAAVLDVFLVTKLVTLGKGILKGSLAKASETAPVVAPNKMDTVRRLGIEGEAASGITKNTQRIESLSGIAKYRIPDELTPTTLREVKNVARLDFSAQIRDSLHYSIMTGREFVLVVRRTTQLSQPIQDAVRAGIIRLEFLP